MKTQPLNSSNPYESPQSGGLTQSLHPSRWKQKCAFWSVLCAGACAAFTWILLVAQVYVGLFGYIPAPFDGLAYKGIQWAAVGTCILCAIATVLALRFGNGAQRLLAAIFGAIMLPVYVSAAVKYLSNVVNALTRIAS
jgi:hypothetical protein